MNSCTRKCIQYKANKVEGRKRYSIGQKYCTGCDIFINWDGKDCPCCNRHLRISPRSSKSKREYLEQIAK